MTSSAKIRVAQVNPIWLPGQSPGQILEEFPTLTGWAEALTLSGASVTVLQRFSTDAEIIRNEVSYRFVPDGGPPSPGLSVRAMALAQSCRDQDVVQFHGLHFPRLLAGIARSLPATSILVARHHGGQPDEVRWRRWLEGIALSRCDALLFSAAEQARPWKTTTPIVPIMEAGSTLEPIDQQEARRLTGIDGAPAVAWIGHLSPTKDPLTVLRALAEARKARPGIRLWMAFREAGLRPSVEAEIRRLDLDASVDLLGPLDRVGIARLLSACEVFVSASHSEGSGYSAIEALACGCFPILTDIPSFRALTDDGRIGHLWPVGNEMRLAAHLREAPPATRTEVMDWSGASLSWSALGKAAMDHFRRLLDQKRSGP